MKKWGIEQHKILKSLGFYKCSDEVWIKEDILIRLDNLHYSVSLSVGESTLALSSGDTVEEALTKAIPILEQEAESLTRAANLCRTSVDHIGEG